MEGFVGVMENDHVFGALVQKGLHGVKGHLQQPGKVDAVDLSEPQGKVFLKIVKFLD